MTVEQSGTAIEATGIEQELLTFLEDSIKQTVEVDHDLFGSGLVSSMFAMQLVVHIEDVYDVAIIGPDLKLDNFRTVSRMAQLVLSLKEKPGDD